MGSATVIAELIAQGRGGLGPGWGRCAGRRWLVRTSVAWPRGSDFLPCGHASGELAALRLSVQAIVAGR